MEVKYVCPLISVRNVNKSREFYENVLKQEVEIDHGENVAFKGGFAIHDVEHFQSLTGVSMFEKALIKISWNYIFEVDDINKLEEKLKSLNVKFVHKIREQPWGQRRTRFYDPDNYIIEIGEPLELVIKRFRDIFL